MSTYVKSILTAMMSIAILSNAYADTDAIRTADQSIDQKSVDQGELAVRYHSSKHSHKHKPKPKTTPGQNKRSVKGILEVGYTYWLAEEEGLNTFRTTNWTVNRSLAAAEKGKEISPKTKARSGFKVAAGITMEEEQLELLATYSWFNNNFKGNRTNYTWADGLTFDLWTANNNIGSGYDDWRIWFQYVDFNIAAMYKPFHILTVKPYFGLVGAWEKQWLYTLGSTTTTLLQYVNQNQEWWGIGPQVGARTALTFFETERYHIYFFGDAALGEVWSYTSHEYRTLTRQSPQQVGRWDVSNTWTLSPMMKVQLGLHDDLRLKNANETHIYGSIAWELQTWFNHNQMRPGTERGMGSTNFMLQGLTLMAGARF